MIPKPNKDKLKLFLINYCIRVYDNSILHNSIIFLTIRRAISLPETLAVLKEQQHPYSQVRFLPLGVVPVFYKRTQTPTASYNSYATFRCKVIWFAQPIRIICGVYPVVI